MRSKIVKYIFKKEMLDILRDKKTLFMMIILPVILYPVMMILLTQVMVMSTNSMNEKELPIAIKGNADSQLISMINDNDKKDEKGDKEESGKLKIVKVKDYKKAINDESIVAYIEVKENNKKYNVYTNSSVSDSNTAIQRIEKVFEDYKQEKINENLKEKGLDVKQTLEPIVYKNIDIAKNEELAGHMLGQILPFILIIGILLGAIYPAIDVMAGEKERGTLETLLTLPISNLELVMGKYMAVSFSAIVTAIFNLLSIALTLIYLVTTSGLEASELGIGSLDLNKLIFPIIITIICVCIFAMVVSAISMCVCSLAKSFKDAQNYMTPIMLLVMIPSYVSMVPNIELDKFTATIPVVNISLLIKSVLSFKSDLGLVALVLVSNIAFVILSVMLLSKMFDSEEILFGNKASFSFLEKRSNIKKGNMPSVSDGVILYAISLVLLIYVGSIVQMKLGLGGLAITQIMIIGLPLIFAYYIKLDFKKIFSIKIPKIKHIIGAILLWGSAYILVNLSSQILLHIFPQNMEIIENLNHALYQEKFLINLLVIALMPAICEEMLFRGFIFTSFKSKKGVKMAIIGSAILFGFMHIDFIRIVPTAILGISFAFAVYKSESIFVSMLMHFINNGLVVLAMHYPKNTLIKSVENLTIFDPNLNVLTFIGLLAISIILLIVSLYLFKKTKAEKSKSTI